MEISKQKILVTGSNGYIGTVLVPMLAEEGCTVVGFDNNLFHDCLFGTCTAWVETICKDIRDIASSDLAGFDAVIHLAGLSNDPLGDLNPEYTYDINHKATVSLGKKAKAAGVRRFLFSSTCSIYGASGDDYVDESSPVSPITHYARSKVLAEQGLFELADDDFCVTFLRNATVYGYSPRMRFDLVVNELAACSYLKGEIVLRSDGTSWRPLAHVEDVARCFIEILKAPQDITNKAVFNVGRDEDNVRIIDIAEMIRGIVPGSKLVFESHAGPDARNYRVRFGKVMKVLPQFQPIWRLDSGIAQMRKFFHTFSLTQEGFEGEAYRRVVRLKRLMDEGALDPDLRWADG